MTKKKIVKGLAGSRGIAKGYTFLAFSKDEALSKVGAVGDILVAPMTDPTWTLIFPRIKAVVTDIGGIASHAAIVARELGIPAVVGTGNATNIFKDGDCVIVNGDEGVVYECNDS